MANQWIIQELLAEKSDVLEWDTWLIGTIEDGYFLEKYRALDKKDATSLVEILKWWETFENGIIIDPETIKEQIAKKNPVKKKPVRKTIAKK
jgi:hypothetical protein